MNRAPSNINAERSSTWLKKGMETLNRMGRMSSSSHTRSANPLRELFSDLIAFVVFFETICEQQPPLLSDFREKVIALLNAQEERAKSNGIAVEAFRTARFAVLSWVDETVLTSKWPHRNQWQHLMLAYYGTLNAGEEFFRRLKSLPPDANDIREIYFLCISLGFQGEHAFGSDARELQALKQALYKQLCATYGDIRQSYPRLFPEAYQKAHVAPRAVLKSNRIWYITAACLIVVLFAVYWFLLNREAGRLIAMLDKPAPPVPRQSDWSASLIGELRGRGIPAEETSRGVLITLPTLLFQANSADLNPQAHKTINDIVETVKRHAPDRSIVVEGHASREGNPELNRNLSERRAQTVADAFVRFAFRNERIRAIGFGSDKPKPGVSDAANRRVEITVIK